jgi:hypothetical protein
MHAKRSAMTLPGRMTRLGVLAVAARRRVLLIAAAAALSSCSGCSSASGSAALSWIPPTRNTDGSPITDLAGYYVYYGRSPAALTHSIQIRDAALTSYVISNLEPATYYFSVVAYSVSGAQSSLAAPVSKSIR